MSPKAACKLTQQGFRPGPAPWMSRQRVFQCSLGWALIRASGSVVARCYPLGTRAVTERHVQRRLAAILAADIAGYSRLTGADEEGTLERLRALRLELIDPAVAEHHGRIVKTTGDGILIEFASVVDAVRCGIAVQRGMARRNTEVSVEKRILFRVGINLGDVVAEGDDLLGDGVNVAARLEGIAEPGGMCLSRAAYDQARGKIDLAVKDLGEQRLKNIAEPVRVYSVSINGNASVSFGDGVQRGVPSASSSSVSATYRYGAGISAAVAVLIAIVVGTVWFGTRSTPPPSQTPRLSIVVLPFANLSGDPAQDYLADVLTEGLTTGLSRISGTFVIARSTAFTYKGKPVDVKQIGKDLGVRYVLEGSEQHSGNQVRVNAQLIDAETGAHLWADQFDADRADLLQMQDEIVTRLARAMQIQLVAVDAARVTRTRPGNLDAEDLALRCEAGVYNSPPGSAEFPAVLSLCDRALHIDNGNVFALTLMTMMHIIRSSKRGAPIPRLTSGRRTNLSRGHLPSTRIAIGLIGPKPMS
jgi:adenylate cyclase